MMDPKIKLYLEKLKNCYLVSFGICNQFIEISFSGEEFDEILFFIDCKISTSDSEVLVHKEFFERINPDVADISLFIKANNIQIESYNFFENKLYLLFANEYDLIFELFENYGEPLSITFKSEQRQIAHLLFRNNGVVELITTPH